MRVLILLALVGAALAVPSFKSRMPQRIVGGSPTTVNNWPMMANMQYGFFGFWWQWCGGAVITRSSILSAAHCYYLDSPNSWRVRLGTSFASSGGDVHNVNRLLLHENYDDNMITHDFAIVFLSTPAVYSDTIAAAFIAAPDYNLADGTLVTSIGWGTLTQGGSSPEQLQEVDIYTINHGLCAERYAYLKTQPGYAGWPDIDDSMLCAGILDVGGADACQGDSGGPLLHNRNVIVGVVSWGFGCAHAVYPGVNADVSYASNWILVNGST